MCLGLVVRCLSVCSCMHVCMYGWMYVSGRDLFTSLNSASPSSASARSMATAASTPTAEDDPAEAPPFDFPPLPFPPDDDEEEEAAAISPRASMHSMTYAAYSRHSSTASSSATLPDKGRGVDRGVRGGEGGLIGVSIV